MKRILYIILLTLSTIGCEKSDDIVASQNNVEFSFSLSRHGESNFSDVSMKTSFSTKDLVGIISDNTQCKWIYTDGKWFSSHPLRWHNLDPITFSAYYPYVEEATFDKVPMPSLLQQTGHQFTMDSLDFVCGQRTINYRDSKGTVTFDNDNALSHQYALVVLTIQSKFSNTTSYIQNITLEGEKLFNSAYYSFKDKKVYISPEQKQNTLFISWEKFPKYADKKYLLFKILVNPMKLDSHAKLTLHYTYNNQEMTETQALSNEFKSGYYYRYDISINARGEATMTGIDVNGRKEEILPDLNLPK